MQYSDIMSIVKKNYEKVIVLCCFLFIFSNIGLESSAFSVHQPYIVTIEGIGDTGGSLILSVSALTSAIIMIFIDRYYALLNLRIGIPLACFFISTGFLIYSQASALPVFFIGSLFLGAGYGLGGLAAMTFLLNRWFDSGVGTMMGFATMGSGLASVIMPPIVVSIIEGSSLSTAFTVEAGIAACIGVICLALLRNRPEEMGLKPYSSKKKKRHRLKTTMVDVPKSRYIFFLASVVLVGIYCCGGMTYLAILATSSGFSGVFAALLVSIAGTALTAGKFIAGRLLDCLGTRRGSAVVFSFAIVGFSLAIFAGLGNEALMIVAALLLGLGFSLGSVGVPTWSLDLSDPSNRDKQVRNCQLAYTMGGFIARTLPGIIKDLLGSYVISYCAMLIFAGIAAIVVLRFYRVYGKKTQDSSA